MYLDLLICLIYIYYFHLKGITRNLDDKYRPMDWIEYMLYYTMENYKLDLEYLDKGYCACGVDFLEGLRCCPFHYSGNFWWVDSTSLSKTNKEPPKLGSPRLDYEFYILECFRLYILCIFYVIYIIYSLYIYILYYILYL